MKPRAVQIFAAFLLMPAPAVSAQDCGLPVQSRKVDEYGDLPAAEEESRLDKLAAALKAEHEDTVAFIVAYVGR